MRARTALLSILTAALLVGASPVAARQEPPRLDAAIPPADRERYAEQWKTEWRNPRVLVDRGGVFLLLGDSGLRDDSAYVQDLAAALVALPREAWPHGRIVALAQTPRMPRWRAGQPRPTDPALDLLDRTRETLRALGVETIETPVGCGCK